MDFRDLAYVVAIAEHQNITHAAQALYVSQPTLSKFLQGLERSMGQPLFKRLGNKLMLTYAGRRYVAKAMDILNLKKELDEEMADIIKRDVGELSVGFPVMRGTYMLPLTLPEFKKRYPNVKVQANESTSEELEEALLKGQIDLAFFNLPIRSRDVDYEVISHEELLLAINPDHPLARLAVRRDDCAYPWFDVKALKDELLLLQVPEQRTRNIVDLLLHENGLKNTASMITKNIHASYELAARGYGVCFICETHARNMNIKDPPLLFSIGHPRLLIDFVVAYRKSSYLSDFSKCYIQIVKDFVLAENQSNM